MEVRFYDTAEDAAIRFVVIVARHQGRFLLCKHRERSTYEFPGGRREAGESVLQAARRELAEETGATQFDLVPICVYSVTGKTRVNETGEESFGMLYHARVHCLEAPLTHEIGTVELWEELPEDLTYPQIQPLLVERYRKWKNVNPPLTNGR